MRTPPQRYRRSVLDLSRSQAGDVSARDSAGRDIHVSGLDPAEALAFIREYIWDSDQERERQIGRLADALELHEISERQRRDADARERKRRQRVLNAWLALITGLAVATAWQAFGLAARVRDLLDAAAPALATWRP